MLKVIQGKSKMLSPGLPEDFCEIKKGPRKDPLYIRMVSDFNRWSRGTFWWRFS